MMKYDVQLTVKCYDAVNRSIGASASDVRASDAATAQSADVTKYAVTAVLV